MILQPWCGDAADVLPEYAGLEVTRAAGDSAIDGVMIHSTTHMLVLLSNTIKLTLAARAGTKTTVYTAHSPIFDIVGWMAVGPYYVTRRKKSIVVSTEQSLGHAFIIQNVRDMQVTFEILHRPRRTGDEGYTTVSEYIVTPGTRQKPYTNPTLWCPGAVNGKQKSSTGPCATAEPVVE